MRYITSKDNSIIKNTAKLINSSKFRKQSGLFVCEGLRICYDAMLSGAKIDSVFVTQQAVDKYGEKLSKIIKYADNCFTVSLQVFSHISETKSPQGVLCVIKTLDKSGQFDTIKDNGKFLALDNVQDPNNLGTILRSAEAFGIDGIVLSEDCCDVYNPKVVRGSMGAVFRLPFTIYKSISDFLFDNPRIKSYASVVDPNAMSVKTVNFKAPCVIIIGNEGNGIKSETLNSCSERITIPMSGKAESLNASAAATILIWEMIR